MEYGASAGNMANIGSFQQVQNSFGGGTLGGIKNAEAPRTVASAIGRIDGLNERLQGIRSQLANVSDMIGGPRNLASGQKANAAPSPSGAVHRLNDSADHGHSIIADIEDLLSSIQRSLG